MILPTLTPRDFPEDFENENGMYFNTCFECTKQFIGYKRRTICRVCLVQNQEKVFAQPQLP